MLETKAKKGRKRGKRNNYGVVSAFNIAIIFYKNAPKCLRFNQTDMHIQLSLLLHNFPSLNLLCYFLLLFSHVQLQVNKAVAIRSVAVASCCCWKPIRSASTDSIACWCQSHLGKKKKRFLCNNVCCFFVSFNTSFMKILINFRFLVFFCYSFIYKFNFSVIMFAN